MPSSGEPLELQLQRERVARTQVEAALEAARLQLIEMEHALRQARAEATACLTAAPGHGDAAVVADAQPQTPAPLDHPGPSRPRPRKSIARPDAAARAVMNPAGVRGAGGTGPILSTLDLHVGDHRAIVADFIRHLQTRLSKMQACYGGGNTTELKWHVNWITLNADRCGFPLLTTPAKELEEVIEQQLNGRIAPLLDAVIHVGERMALEPARR